MEMSPLIHPILITSLDDPRIRHFVAAREPELRRAGLMLVESARVVKRLTQSLHPLQSLLATPEYWQDLGEGQVRAWAGAEIYLADSSLLAGIVGHHLHDGVMAAATRPVDVSPACMGPRILILNGVNNAENVGGLIRSAVAFGVRDVIVDAASCSPWARRASRVSMGAVFRCRVWHSKDLIADIGALRAKNYRVWGAGLEGDAKALSDVKTKGQWALVMGAENDGLQAAVARACDATVTIPMPGGIDSLNVLAAGAILLHHLGGEGEGAGAGVV